MYDPVYLVEAGGMPMHIIEIGCLKGWLDSVDETVTHRCVIWLVDETGEAVRVISNGQK